MKILLRYILLFSFALVTSNYLLHNLSFGQGLTTLLLVAFVTSCFELILKPVIKILLLPLTILTLGLIRIIINVIGLYLATFLLTDFIVHNIDIAPTFWYNFTSPRIKLDGFLAYLATSVVTAITFNTFKYIVKRKEKK